MNMDQLILTLSVSSSVLRLPRPQGERRTGLGAATISFLTLGQGKILIFKRF